MAAGVDATALAAEVRALQSLNIEALRDEWRRRLSSRWCCTGWCAIEPRIAGLDVEITRRAKNNVVTKRVGERAH